MATDREDPTASSEQRPPPAGSSPPSPDAFPTAEELRSISAEISALYPPPRLGTELVLLEVNPHRAHAYWNVDVEDYRDGRRRTGIEHPALVLRLYDVTGVEFNGRNAHTAFDIEVQGLQGHWYVDLWMDGRTHVADLGFRLPDGSLVCLARSNSVATPPAKESREYNTLALDTGRGGPAGVRITDLISDPDLSPYNLDPETGGPLETAPDDSYVVQPTSQPFQAPGHVDESEAPATVPLEPSRAAADRIIPLPGTPPPVEQDVLQQEIRALFERSAFVAAPAQQPWQSPDSPLPEAPAPVASNAASSDAASPDDGERWPSAEELARHVPDTGGQPAASETSAPAPTVPAGSSPMPLDSYVSLSSFAVGRREVALEVNVELHIYGRAKPGTELTLYGQPVPLQPDGSFSVRKPLPHGAIVLPLLAVDPPAPPDEG